MKEDNKFVRLNNLTAQLKECNKDELEQVRELIETLIQERSRPTVELMRTFDEYQDARLEAEEELPALTEVLMAPGRQFCLTPAQKQIIEAKVGHIAHREITTYNVSFDALEERVLSFSAQCNVPKGQRARGRVSAFHIEYAQEFFRDSHRLEDDLAAQQAAKGVGDKDEPKSKKKSEREKKREEINNLALDLLKASNKRRAES